MALRLSGGSDFAARATGVTSSDPYTLMMWIRRDSATAGANMHILADGTGTQYEGIYLNGSGTGIRIVYQGDSADGSTALTAGTWYHIALLRNGSSRTLYLDGVSEVTLSGANAFTSAQEAIGGNGLSSFPGYMAALKIWDAALSLDEIQREMWTITPWRTANINTFSPLFRHTDLVNYVGTGWSITGTGLTDDGPPVSWGASPIIVPFVAAATGVPTLSAPGVNSITSTSAIPKVTLTF